MSGHGTCKVGIKKTNNKYHQIFTDNSKLLSTYYLNDTYYTKWLKLLFII